MYIQVVTVNTQCTMNIHYIHCDFVEEIGEGGAKSHRGKLSQAYF